MSTLQAIREMIDAAEDPEPDILEAVSAARELLDPTLTDHERKLWNVILDNSIGIAVSNGHLYGPKLIRSAVELQGKARAHAASKFADATSSRMLELAGFTREEIEDGERAAIQHMIDTQLGAYFKQLRAELCRMLGVPVSEDDE